MHDRADRIGAPEGQALTTVLQLLEGRAVGVERGVVDPLQAHVDVPVAGDVDLDREVLGLQVDLVGRDGTAEVAAGRSSYQGFGVVEAPGRDVPAGAQDLRVSRGLGQYE